MSKKHFEIGMWGLNNEAADEETFRLIAEAGITHVFMNGQPSVTEVQKKILTLCEKYGLKVYIFAGSLLDRLQVLHDDPTILQSYSAFDGIIAFDEPTVYQLDDVCNLVRGFQERYGERTAFVNLFPSYVDLNNRAKIVGASTYEEYIDVCCNKLFGATKGRRILSIDFYPLCIDLKTGKNYIFPDYLSDLEVGRKYADKYHADLHFCLQTTAFGKEHRAPGEEDFRFQFYVCFAFGVNGFSYFTYESPLNEEFREEHVGLIDRQRKPTQRHAYAKTVKKEIEAFEASILSAKHSGVKTFIGSKNTDSIAPFEKLRYCVKEFRCVERVRCTQNALVGEYVNGDETSYVAVNFTEPTENKRNTLEIALRTISEVLLYRKGTLSVFLGDKFTAELEPGEGIYFIVRNKSKNTA